jgi:hypothetical protein
MELSKKWNNKCQKTHPTINKIEETAKTKAKEWA